MVYFAVKIYFVNTCEIASFTVSEPLRSPFTSLQRILASRGIDSFCAAWSDEYHNLFPLKSDQHFVDALRSRQHPLQPLRIFIKESRLAKNYGHRGYPLSFPGSGHIGNGPRGGSCDRDAPPPAWSRHKVSGINERLSSATSGGNTARDVPQQQQPQVRLSNSALLPKDPSLAELVDKVRHNLDLVASMHDSLSLEPKEDGSASVTLKEEPVCSPTVKTVSAAENVVFVIGGENSTENTAEKAMCELLEEFAEEEAQLHQVPRPESAMSDEFMVVTPATTDSCVHFSIEDFEAAMSELDSEDTFEIVDTPDDWDSDVEWKHVQADGVESLTIVMN